jgi:hypothetical protein
MEIEKTQLQLLMKTALKTEENLREEIEVMREIILKYNNQKIESETRSNPTHLASIEIQGSDLKGLNIGALSSLQDLRTRSKSSQIVIGHT